MNVEGMAVGLLFGIAGPLIAYILTKLIYGSEDLFAKLPLHWMYWPAIGGLVVGWGGFLVPQVLGVGYDTIQGLAVGQVALSLALKILLVKTIVWIISLGSGTSGGILAPILIIGGTLGEIMGILFHAPDPAVWSILGMASVFAGVTRSPFTAVLFLLELTHDMQMLLPLTIACFLAYTISTLVLSRSILTEKLARRGRLITRDYSIDPLELYTLAELPLEQPVIVSEEMTLAEIIRLQAESEVCFEDFLVVSTEGRLIGYMKHSELWKWVYNKRAPLSRVGDHCVCPVNTIACQQPVSEALTLLLEDSEQKLVVIDEHHYPKGIVTASMLLRIRERTAEEEQDRRRYLILPWLRRAGSWKKLAIHTLQEVERNTE